VLERCAFAMGTICCHKKLSQSDATECQVVPVELQGEPVLEGEVGTGVTSDNVCLRVVMCNGCV
jgi:hypothetical protein